MAVPAGSPPSPMVCEKGLPMASCPDPAPWANWGEGRVLGLGAGPGWSFGSSPISPGGGGNRPSTKALRSGGKL